MKRIITALSLAFILCAHVFAHSGKPDFHVIIDTDGALDDLRSISMLLAESDIQVLGITCSQGSLDPSSVYEKVNTLLTTYHHEGIPIGIGKKVDVALPTWASFSETINWGNTTPTMKSEEQKEALELIHKTIDNYPKKVTLVALGSLKAYADVIKAYPALDKKIERIIWYNSHIVEEGYNYSVSPESYAFIKETNIPLEIVANAPHALTVNNAYQERLKQTTSIYGKQINLAHQQANVQALISKNHINLWDDLVPVYIRYQGLFETKTQDNIKLVNIRSNVSEKHVQDTIARILVSGAANNNRVFSQFPVEASLYKTDYAKIMDSTIEKFGNIEWKAIAMTNEVHGHTGIYSIIGAKMGIRTMEYFNVGLNNLTVTTYAGRKPPLSCFNDGIQISSGSTIGQGLITVADSISTIPTIAATYNKQTVIVSLKEEIAKAMRKDIKLGIEKHGLLTDPYWDYIEQLGIEYWAKFDRHDIFTIEKINSDD